MRRSNVLAFVALWRFVGKKKLDTHTHDWLKTKSFSNISYRFGEGQTVFAQALNLLTCNNVIATV